MTIIRRLFISACLILLASSFANTSYAQLAVPTPEATIEEAPEVIKDAKYVAERLMAKDTKWAANFSYQSAESLRSKVAQVRANTMQNIIHYATTYGDAIDLRATTAGLLNIFENDEDERHRLMALSALNAIGDEASMTQLLEHDLKNEPSERIRHLTAVVLHGYFNGR